MPESFFEKPILYSPYEYPRQRWKLDETRQLTQRVLQQRRLIAGGRGTASELER